MTGDDNPYAAPKETGPPVVDESPPMEPPREKRSLPLWFLLGHWSCRG